MLEIRHLSHSFSVSGEIHPVIEDLSFSVQDREFFVILGQSGCGKSTLLRIIGGFLKPDSGFVCLDGKTVTAPSKDQMMVFQGFDQLFPWFTLRGNLLYALKKAHMGIPAKELPAYADRYLSLAGLDGFGDSYPHQLSGGMKQRGALARALCLRPGILLMDEPFSSLDAITKKNSYAHVRTLARQVNCTILLVTHDIEEALLLGTSIAVLSKVTKRFSAVYPNQPGTRSQALRDELETQLL